MPPETEDYKAEQIQVLEGLEAVRKRPAMYIGSTSRDGLHHLVYEVVDNSIDEAMNGHCDTVTVELHKDGSCSVRDNGRGIPVDNHPQYKVPALEIVMTKLHAGGKFDSDTYKVSGGLHGVGVSVVTGLSEWTRVDVRREGGQFRQSYQRGVADGPLERISDSDEHGTLVCFKPDSEIFETTRLEYELLRTRFRELAYLNAGLSISISEEGGRSESFCFEGGLAEYVSFLNDGRTKLMREPLLVTTELEQVQVDAALQWTTAYREHIHTFANNIATREGGTHLSGLRSALTRTLNTVALKRKQLKEKDTALDGSDVREPPFALGKLPPASDRAVQQSKVSTPARPVLLPARWCRRRAVVFPAGCGGRRVRRALHGPTAAPRCHPVAPVRSHQRAVLLAGQPRALSRAPPRPHPVALAAPGSGWRRGCRVAAFRPARASSEKLSSRLG